MLKHAVIRFDGAKLSRDRSERVHMTQGDTTRALKMPTNENWFARCRESA